MEGGFEEECGFCAIDDLFLLDVEVLPVLWMGVLSVEAEEEVVRLLLSLFGHLCFAGGEEVVEDRHYVII